MLIKGDNKIIITPPCLNFCDEDLAVSILFRLFTEPFIN